MARAAGAALEGGLGVVALALALYGDGIAVYSNSTDCGLTGWRLLCEPEARNTSTKGAWCKGSEFLGPCQEVEGIFYGGGAAAHLTGLNGGRCFEVEF